MKKEFLVELLGYVSENPSATVEALASKYSTFLHIAEASEDSLADVLCGDKNAAFYIKLCAAVASRRQSDRFVFGRKHTEDEICEYLSALLFGMAEETVYMISIDSHGRCVGADRVGEGIVNFSSVLPRKVVDVAKRRGASSVIIAHNHPGGYLVPSGNDVSATALLAQLLDSSEIRLEKSYIFSGAEHAEVEFKDI